jgi:hypothetical protein
MDLKLLPEEIQADCGNDRRSGMRMWFDRKGKVS